MAAVVDVDRVRQLVDAHATARDRLTAAAVAAAVARVRGFDGWYDHAAITTMAGLVARQVGASQRQTAAVTDTFLARVLSLLLGRRVRPAGVIAVGGLRSGVTPAGPYGRVADLYRWRVSEGDDPGRALERAVGRAEVVADMDVMLAFRAQAQATLRSVTDADVAGWRRVVHPELSRGGSCGLCIVAADRLYSTDELLPVHERCACTVLPVVGAAGGPGDPGARLDRASLDAFYDAAGSNRAADLKRTRYVVHDHGELGPVLRQAGDDFRGPAQVAADTAA